MLVSGDIPKDYAEKIKLQPVRCLVSIGTMWKQGWEVEPHQWMMLSQAPDPSTVNKIIRAIKKKPAKKGSLQIEWDAEGKVLTMWENDTPHNVYLTFDENDESIQRGLARLFDDKVMPKESNL
jgi:hypothetical protein